MVQNKTVEGIPMTIVRGNGATEKSHTRKYSEWNQFIVMNLIESKKLKFKNLKRSLCHF